MNLTRRFFAEKGVADYRIVESLGATEGAPGTGAAELIVDITTTGTTLAANALKVLDDGVILRSEANLVAAVGAPWTPRARAAAQTLLTRIAAREEARASREIRAAIDPVELDGALAFADEYGASLPFGPPAAGELVLHCPAAQVFALAAALQTLGGGARTVAVRTLDYVFRPRNPLTERLAQRIG